MQAGRVYGANTIHYSDSRKACKCRERHIELLERHSFMVSCFFCLQNFVEKKNSSNTITRLVQAVVKHVLLRIKEVCVCVCTCTLMSM